MALFGTDGIRGRANQWPITPDVIMKVGRAIAHYFQRSQPGQTSCGRNTAAGADFFPYTKHIHDPGKLTVVVGKDTRQSGYMIENAITSGLTAQGANVIMLGPMPTPAVSMLVRSLRVDIGVMISASHNPFYDNGIKFFDANGLKFDKELEAAIEKVVAEDFPLSVECGGAIRLNDAAGRYVEFAKGTFPKGLSLNGLKIVLDCANGAAYKVAPRVFWELGAYVVVLADQPNGCNINQDCGALHPEKLIDCVRQSNADIGLALDGDADRLLIVTPSGATINGDQMLALIAKDWSERGILNGGVVATNMSNIGLMRFLQTVGIPYFESEVGDKNVIAMMNARRSNLGGEESGHVILNDYTTTGDGIIAALQILAILVSKGGRIEELCPVFREVPVGRRNVKGRANRELISRAVAYGEALVRASDEAGADGVATDAGVASAAGAANTNTGAAGAAIADGVAADAGVAGAAITDGVAADAGVASAGGVTSVANAGIADAADAEATAGAVGVGSSIGCSGNDGPLWKIVVRCSGTEPVVRVMVQHSSTEIIERVVRGIVAKLESDLTHNSTCASIANDT
jgi:phosphoglucosamine mutase